MPQNISISPSQQPARPKIGNRWLRTFFIGLILFLAATLVMFLTGNINLYPTVILIGNFLVPVVFVAFLYDHQHISALTTECIASSFCIGGVFGVLGASILETLLLPAPDPASQGLTLFSAFVVGLVEEGCKILAVIFLARKLPHTSQMDGLLLGGAVGMGFAALESTGYAFSAFLLSNGHFTASIIETIIRGLLAPFGHGTWTAILGAVLFRESTDRHFRINIPVIITYLFVSGLHAFGMAYLILSFWFFHFGLPFLLILSYSVWWVSQYLHFSIVEQWLVKRYICNNNWIIRASKAVYAFSLCSFAFVDYV